MIGNFEQRDSGLGFVASFSEEAIPEGM